MSGTLFISDLDGTLLDADSKISDTSAEKINKAMALGANVSIATARTPSTVSTLIEGIDFRLPIIVMTGSAIWNPRDGDFIHKVTIPKEIAEQVLAIFKEFQLPVFIYTLPGNVINVYHYGALSPLEKKFLSEREHSRYKLIKRENDNHLLLPEKLEDVTLFYAMQPYEIVRPVYEAIREKVECYPLCYHDIFGEATGLLEVFSAKTSKARALEWIKNKFGFDYVIAFGDNLNDIPLLRAADVAVAVENARPEVKHVADIVLPPNTENSVADFILQTTLDSRKIFF